MAVTSPLQCLTVDTAASVQGHAITSMEVRKRSLHQNACQSVGVSFIPLVMETLGGWSSVSVTFFQALVRRQKQRLGSGSVSHLLQRLSVSLWCSNASAWITRTPSTRPVRY